MTDPRDGSVAGLVVAVCHAVERSSLLLPLVRMLARAGRGTDGGRAAPADRRSCSTAFRRLVTGHEWVLATDGDVVLTNAGARQLDGADLRVLSDLVVAGLVLHEFTGTGTSTCRPELRRRSRWSRCTWPAS